MKILYLLRVVKIDKHGNRVPVKWNPLLFIIVLSIGIFFGIIEFFKTLFLAFKETYG